MPIAVDTFTDADGSLLTAHVSNSGHTWGVIEGPLNTTILANRARMSFAFGIRSYCRYSLAPVSPDYEVFADILHESNTSEDSEVWARIPSGSVGGYFTRVTGMAGGARILLFRRSLAGADTQLGFFDTGVTIAGVAQRAGIRVTGTLIEAIYNDAVVLSVVDATHAGPGHAGIGGKGAGAGAADIFIDNFSVDYTAQIEFPDPEEADYGCDNDPVESVQDTFTDPNGTLLQAHIPDSAVPFVWTQLGANVVTIQNNRLSFPVSGAASRYRANIDAENEDDDYEVTAFIVVAGPNSSVSAAIGLVLPGTQNGYRIVLSKDIGGNLTFGLGRMTGGGVASLGNTGVIADPPDGIHELRLLRSGNNITAFWRGAEILTAVDATWGAVSEITVDGNTDADNSYVIGAIATGVFNPFVPLLDPAEPVYTVFGDP